MSTQRATALMASVVVARSISLLFSKTALAELSPFNLLALRFLAAFFVLAAVFHKRLGEMRMRDILRGGLMGLALTATLSCEMRAISFIPTGELSFLSNTAVVLVPLFAACLEHRAPKLKNLLCSLVALAGVGFLALGGKARFAFGPGELAGIGEACCYATMIVLTGRFSQKSDPLSLGIVQMGSAGTCCLLVSCWHEEFALPAEACTWASILVLVLACSVFGFAFQPVAQRYISTEQAGSMCALAPVVAMLLGVLFLKERFTASMLFGAGLVLASLALSNRAPHERARTKKRPARAFLAS